MAEIYQVKVEGILDEQWSDWFNGLTIEVGSGSDDPLATTLTVAVSDQAKLRGILSRIWDLNLTVISVARIEPGARHRNGAV